MVFDQAGRLLSATMNGGVYRRGTDGSILRIERQESGTVRYHDTRRLDVGEADQLLHQIHIRLHAARSLLGDGFAPLMPATTINLKADAAIFRKLYRGVGILPPDRYRALVLNLTEGCSYNRCSFCSFYRNKTYRVRSTEVFRRHVQSIVAAFGAGLAYRRGIFLGQANAASLALDSLLGALATIREMFPCKWTDLSGRPRHPLDFERVSAFLDTFTRPRRSVQDWVLLRRAGLDSVYLGVESGSPRALKLLGKPGAPRHVGELVSRLKQAGVKVNVIIMSGVGGREMAQEHMAATTALLNSLPLVGEDRIHISEMVVQPGSKYSRTDLEHLDRVACRLQTRAIRAGLRFPEPPRGPAATLYDIRQFVY